MSLRKSVELEDQMACSLCSWMESLSWATGGSALVLFSAWFWGFSFLSIFFTSLILFPSCFYITLSSKQNPQLVEKVEETARPEEEISTHLADDVVPEQPVKTQKMVETKENGLYQSQKSSVRAPNFLQESPDQVENAELNLIKTPERYIASQMKDVSQMDNYLASPILDASSETESLYRSSTSEDSEVDWMFRDNAGHSSDDGSISDEDSLIEIAIPSGHYVSTTKDIDQPLFNLLNQKLPGFATDCMFNQSLMELLSDTNEFVNEEDNLIEIDISMGSIKCPRFEIEA